MKQNNDILIVIFIIIFLISLYYLFRINKCNESYQELLTSIQSNNVESFIESKHTESQCASLESPPPDHKIVKNHSTSMINPSEGDSSIPELNQYGELSSRYKNNPSNKSGTLYNPGGKCNPDLPPLDYHTPSHLSPIGHPETYKQKCKDDTEHPSLPQFPPHYEIINADCDNNPNYAIKDCESRCKNFNPYDEMKDPEKVEPKHTLPPCKIIPPPLHKDLISTTESDEIPVFDHPHSTKTMPPVSETTCPPCKPESLRPLPHELIKHANKHLELLKAKKKQLSCTPKPFIPQGLSPTGQRHQEQLIRQQQQYRCPPVHSPEMIQGKKC